MSKVQTVETKGRRRSAKLNATQKRPWVKAMIALMPDGTASGANRDDREISNFKFPVSSNDEQDWQPTG